jgi:hypothetical protein
MGKAPFFVAGLVGESRLSQWNIGLDDYTEKSEAIWTDVHASD